MAFSYRLKCLGKADKGREERDHSGQELQELSEIGHGHHLPSNGGLCPARGLPTARTILADHDARCGSVRTRIGLQDMYPVARGADRACTPHPVRLESDRRETRLRAALRSPIGAAYELVS